MPKKSCLFVVCNIDTCDNAKIQFSNAYLHLSRHQLHNHSDFDACVVCGKSDHMPSVSANMISGDSCHFAGNSINAKKTKNIECSLPLANHPLKCDQCQNMLWRFDFQSHFERDGEETCPQVGIISETEKDILSKQKEEFWKRFDTERSRDTKRRVETLTRISGTGTKNVEENFCG